MKKLQKPSDFIKKIFKKYGLNNLAAAKKLGLSCSQVHFLVKGTLRVTNKTALKFEKIFKIPAKKLLMLQLEHSLAAARNGLKFRKKA